jgi:hypothetical protein
LALAAVVAPAPQGAEVERLLPGASYHIEIGESFPAALLHWLDSLADLQGSGTTAGKTVAAHRQEFRKVLGEPTEQDGAMLRRFASVRGRLASHELTAAFFTATGIEQALEASNGILGADSAAFAEAIHHFAPRYQRIWKEGQLPRRFRARAAAEPRAEELARFLHAVARFYGALPVEPPYPRLVVVPVPDGHGTHAQAIDRFLLIEVRPGEGLLDEVAPIVHENAHFLFQRMAAARRQALEDARLALGEDGLRAWRLLHEALPTAIAQGVADERFRGERWSMEQSWYHLDAIDRYAKRLHGLVREALAAGGTFDESFLRRAVALASSPTPR